jgi:hypothetical protein
MLNTQDIKIAKGFLAVGHKQHDVAAHFGVNPGRIAEIAKGKIGSDVKAAPINELPPLNMKGLQSLPRYFTPQQTLEEQKTILAHLIAQPSDAARVYIISPELADVILTERNGTNRQASATKIAEYIDAMSEGRWPVTGATIVFSKSGFLLDGQHRLMACVRAGVPLKTYIVFGIDDGAFSLIDIGRKRTNVDAFAIAKVPYSRVSAAATRWLAIFNKDPEDRSLTLTNDQALRWYNANIQKQLLEDCIRRATEVEKAAKIKGSTIPAGSTAALFYLFGTKSRKDMVEFAQTFADGKAHGRAVMSVVREAMERSGGRIHEVYRNAVIVLAWNAYRNGKRVTQATLNWSSDDGFPTIE